MKTLKSVLLLSVLLVLANIAQAQASYNVAVPKGTSSVAGEVLEDGDTALFCKYIGTNACGSIAVDASTGDLTFTDGTCGAESATSTFECPVSAPLGGVIDVSNAACNTVGEVVDIVNASSNWRCLPYAALRADDLNGLSNAGSLVTISATLATGPNGLGLKYDSSVFASSTKVLASTSPSNQPSGYALLSPGGNSTSFNKNPWANDQYLLSAASVRSTYASGTSLIYVYAVERNFAAAGSETVTTLWGPVTAGATTYEMALGSCTVGDAAASDDGCVTAWGIGGLLAPPGNEVLVRVTNSAAMSVNVVAVNGLKFNASGLGLGGTQ